MSFLRRKNRRRRPLGARLATAAGALLTGFRQTLKIVLVLGLTAALPVGLYVGYQALMRSDYFVITAVRIEGAHRLDRTTVLHIAGLEGRRNIFTVDTDQVAARLLADPWVVDAEVSLDLPRSVDIRLEERQAAGWLYWGHLYRIDADGLVIEQAEASQVDGPLLTGIEPVRARPDDDDSVDASHLLAADRARQGLAIERLYRSQGLPRFDDLAEVHYDDLLGYSLLTRRYHMEVRLGHDRFLERLQRLRDVLVTLQGRDLMGRYILLDSDGALTRVAVGPTRPGRGAADPEAPEPELRR